MSWLLVAHKVNEKMRAVPIENPKNFNVERNFFSL